MRVEVAFNREVSEEEINENNDFLFDFISNFETLAMWLEMELGADVTSLDEDDLLLTDVYYSNDPEGEEPTAIIINSPMLNSPELTEYLKHQIKMQMVRFLLNNPFGLFLDFTVEEV